MEALKQIRSELRMYGKSLAPRFYIFRIDFFETIRRKAVLILDQKKLCYSPDVPEGLNVQIKETFISLIWKLILS